MVGRPELAPAVPAEVVALAAEAAQAGKAEKAAQAEVQVTVVPAAFFAPSCLNYVPYLLMSKDE